METRLPCKVSETQLMWLGVYYFEMFGSVPGEHYRFWHVPGARNCVYLHLFIDIINDCCSPIIPLVHLKQIYTKNFLFITAMQLATHFIRYHPRKHQPLIFTEIFNISRRNSLRVHIKEYYIMCVNISLN